MKKNLKNKPLRLSTESMRKLDSDRLLAVGGATGATLGCPITHNPTGCYSCDCTLACEM